MATLHIFRGLPASGKTTAARRMLASRELGTIVRLNRDDLRRMGLDPEYRQPVYQAEQRITTMRDAALGVLLQSGCDVIVDDTNLRAKYVRQLMVIARESGVEVEFHDFTDVPLDECVRRDSLRSGAEQVGWQVIHDMYSRHLAQLNGKPLPIPELVGQEIEPLRSYVPPTDGEPCVMVDLDGTLALLDRSPYDESCVHTDRPNTAVIETAVALHLRGYELVFMSGRTEKCRDDTVQWILRYVGSQDPTYQWSVGTVKLHMRAIGDTRPDQVVKLELFDRHVRDRYNVRAVLDDRNSVVKLWRSLGLTCLQVADGNF